MSHPTTIFEWTADTAREMIDAQGAVADIGQVTPAARRWLTTETKAGRLIKYRGHWNTLSPFDGIGPLKTIWCLSTPETRAFFARFSFNGDSDGLMNHPSPSRLNTQVPA